jgi:membrane protease YdiL (CAAX protease family)
MDATRNAAWRVLGVLVVYNVIQNTVVSDRAYVPANLAATAGLLTVARRSGSTWRELGFDPVTLGPGLRLGAQVGAGVVATSAAASASEVTRRFLLDDRANGHTRRGAVYRAAIRFPIGTALFEEVAFRGVLEGLWRRTSGPTTSRIVSAVSFGVWHLIPTYRLFPEMSVGSAGARRSKRLLVALGGAVVTGFAGVGFSWLRDRPDSIAAPWLAHAAYNSGAFLAARRAWQVEPGG